MALSLLMCTGGSQFAFIGVIAGGGAASAALLGVRNAAYGMQMNRMLVPKGWRKGVAAHLTIDESAATASGQWPRLWPCRCCRPVCPSCWPPWWAPLGVGGATPPTSMRRRRQPGQKQAPHDALGRHFAGLCGHLAHQIGGLRRTGPLAE